MIDKTLAYMIDETLRRIRKSFAFPVQQMLELTVNQAHLNGFADLAPGRLDAL